MKKIVLLVLTAVALISVAGAASAQGVYLDFGPNPGYGPPVLAAPSRIRSWL
jgi:hypothetical protein